MTDEQAHIIADLERKIEAHRGTINTLSLALGDLLEHGEDVLTAFGHDEEPCDPDGRGWMTEFCRENGCLRLRTIAAREALE